MSEKPATEVMATDLFILGILIFGAVIALTIDVQKVRTHFDSRLDAIEKKIEEKK